MTPEDIEIMQEKLLQLCHAAGQFGLPEERIARTLVKVGFAIEAAELERQLRYLKSKGWIEEVERALRPDLRRWQTTAPGDEYLMRQRLI